MQIFAEENGHLWQKILRFWSKLFSKLSKLNQSHVLSLKRIGQLGQIATTESKKGFEKVARVEWRRNLMNAEMAE